MLIFQVQKAPASNDLTQDLVFNHLSVSFVPPTPPMLRRTNRRTINQGSNQRGRDAVSIRASKLHGRPALITRNTSPRISSCIRFASPRH